MWNDQDLLIGVQRTAIIDRARLGLQRQCKPSLARTTFRRQELPWIWLQPAALAWRIQAQPA